MHDVAAHLVRFLGARRAIDPAQQRLQPGDIGRIDEEVDQQRHAAERLVAVAVNGIAVHLALPLERHDLVADMRRLEISPVQVGCIATYGEVELLREALPQGRE